MTLNIDNLNKKLNIGMDLVMQRGRKDNFTRPFNITPKPCQFYQPILKHYLIVGLLMIRLENLRKLFAIILQPLLLIIEMRLLTTIKEYLLIERGTIKWQLRTSLERYNLSLIKQIFITIEVLRIGSRRKWRRLLKIIPLLSKLIQSTLR